jgi:pyruvate/2-oxoglutarate dehydrogenase complex dihydrolipoamide acyltransferase (E2) component
MLSSSELAKTLGVSPGRVSQYVAAGRLEGCFSGSGRLRTFDLEKVAVALGKTLHPGQMMGNGAQTKASLKAIQSGPVPQREAAAAPVEARPAGAGATEVPLRDPDRYDMARTQKAEEEARRLRRQNAEAEGRYVLASEVGQTVSRLMAQEVAEVETVLRDGARKIADQLGVDFKEVRTLLMGTWRDHRATRSSQLEMQSAAAGLSQAEAQENI